MRAKGRKGGQGESETGGYRRKYARYRQKMSERKEESEEAIEEVRVAKDRSSAWMDGESEGVKKEEAERQAIAEQGVEIILL